MNPIILKFMIEKREEHGEDSNPLSLVKENFYAVGVFDGMGGSGAAICKSEFGDNHTKAYVASRIILEAINNYMENVKDVRDINSDGIRFTARGRLEQEKSNYPTKASGLRSKLVRDYPTTLAITTALPKEDGSHIVNSYWAGDSRNYLWTQEGFYQISKDDLDTELDPLENLRNDGALSNCICADREFDINNKNINVEGKFVILSATDGCFNYFATPMHFNEVLVTGLKLSDSVEEWESFCKAKITAVTGDDVSLSLLAIGFEDFKDLKETFSNSSIANIEEIKKAQDEIKSLSKKIDDHKDSLENLIQEGWNEYKVSYMKFFNDAEVAVDGLAEENVPLNDTSHVIESVKEKKHFQEIKSESSENTTGPVSNITDPTLETEHTLTNSSRIEKSNKDETSILDKVYASSIEEAVSYAESTIEDVTSPEAEVTISTDVLKDKNKASNTVKDSEKSGFRPIRLNTHPSTSSLRSKANFTKEKKDRRVYSSISDSNSINW